MDWRCGQGEPSDIGYGIFRCIAGGRAGGNPAEEGAAATGEGEDGEGVEREGDGNGEGDERDGEKRERAEEGGDGVGEDTQIQGFESFLFGKKPFSLSSLSLNQSLCFLVLFLLILFSSHLSLPTNPNWP